MSVRSQRRAESARKPTCPKTRARDELFDRQGRSPVLSEEGKALLPLAKGILLGNQEFYSKASSMVEGIEADLCIAIEQGISTRPLMELFRQFSADFANVSLELLRRSRVAGHWQQ